MHALVYIHGLFNIGLLIWVALWAFLVAGVYIPMVGDQDVLPYDYDEVFGNAIGTGVLRTIYHPTTPEIEKSAEKSNADTPDTNPDDEFYMTSIVNSLNTTPKVYHEWGEMKNANAQATRASPDWGDITALKFVYGKPTSISGMYLANSAPNVGNGSAVLGEEAQLHGDLVENHMVRPPRQSTCYHNSDTGPQTALSRASDIRESLNRTLRGEADHTKTATVDASAYTTVLDETSHNRNEKVGESARETTLNESINKTILVKVTRTETVTVEVPAQKPFSKELAHVRTMTIEEYAHKTIPEYTAGTAVVEHENSAGVDQVLSTARTHHFRTKAITAKKVTLTRNVSKSQIPDTSVGSILVTLAGHMGSLETVHGFLKPTLTSLTEQNQVSVFGLRSTTFADPTSEIPVFSLFSSNMDIALATSVSKEPQSAYSYEQHLYDTSTSRFISELTTLDVLAEIRALPHGSKEAYKTPGNASQAKNFELTRSTSKSGLKNTVPTKGLDILIITNDDTDPLNLPLVSSEVQHVFGELDNLASATAAAPDKAAFDVSPSGIPDTSDHHSSTSQDGIEGSDSGDLLFGLSIPTSNAGIDLESPSGFDTDDFEAIPEDIENYDSVFDYFRSSPFVKKFRNRVLRDSVALQSFEPLIEWDEESQDGEQGGDLNNQDTVEDFQPGENQLEEVGALDDELEMEESEFPGKSDTEMPTPDQYQLDSEESDNAEGSDLNDKLDMAGSDSAGGIDLNDTPEHNSNDESSSAEENGYDQDPPAHNEETTDEQETAPDWINTDDAVTTDNATENASDSEWNSDEHWIDSDGATAAEEDTWSNADMYDIAETEWDPQDNDLDEYSGEQDYDSITDEELELLMSEYAQWRYDALLVALSE